MSFNQECGWTLLHSFLLNWETRRDYRYIYSVFVPFWLFCICSITGRYVFADPTDCSIFEIVCRWNCCLVSPDSRCDIDCFYPILVLVVTCQSSGRLEDVWRAANTVTQWKPLTRMSSLSGKMRWGRAKRLRCVQGVPFFFCDTNRSEIERHTDQDIVWNFPLCCRLSPSLPPRKNKTKKNKQIDQLLVFFDRNG